MTEAFQVTESSRHSLGSGLARLRERSRWIIAFGIAIVVLGVLAFSSILTAVLASVYFVGISMIVAGLAEIFMGFQAKSWSRFFLWIILGAIYTLAGAFTFANPLLAAGILTLVLGASLVASGLLRIFLAFQMRAGSAWLGVVASGLITTILGGMILAQWPLSSLYVLGVFLSIDLIFMGLGWISLGMALSRPKMAH